jgi:hypothetical protein
MDYSKMMRLRHKYDWLWSPVKVWDARNLSIHDFEITSENCGQIIDQDGGFEIHFRIGPSRPGGTDKIVKIIPKGKASLGQILYESKFGRNEHLQFVAVVRRFRGQKFTSVDVYRPPKDKNFYPNFSVFIAKHGACGTLELQQS